jgi:DegV family protein with EDD domain
MKEGNPMKRLIAADSSCDMKEIPGVLAIAPLTIQLGDKDFVDDKNLNTEILMEAIQAHKGRSSTACPNVQAWADAFLQADETFVVTMTSALSGTYNSARVAMEMVKAEHPEKKIDLLDSLSTGPEMRLLVEKLEELIQDASLDFDAVCVKIREYKTHTKLFYVLQSLHNMAENGRVSKLVAGAVDILGMRIIATASREGTVQSLSKCRGDRHAMEKLLVHLEEAGYSGGRFRIGHIGNPEGAKRLEDAILSRWPQAQVLCYPSGGLCTYYAEKGGLMIGAECR